MASAIGGSPTSRELKITVVDTAGEDATLTIPLDGITTDVAITTFVDNYASLSNAKVSATVVDKFDLTGIAVSGKPSTSSQSLIANILAIQLEKPNPLNSNKTVSKQIILAAYVQALRNDAVKPHVPVTNSTPLNAMIAFLESNLDFVGLDDAHYPGSWTYNPSSKFGTKLSVTDGI